MTLVPSCTVIFRPKSVEKTSASVHATPVAGFVASADAEFAVLCEVWDWADPTASPPAVNFHRLMAPVETKFPINWTLLITASDGMSPGFGPTCQRASLFSTEPAMNFVIGNAASHGETAVSPVPPVGANPLSSELAVTS